MANTTFDPDLGVGRLQFKCTEFKVVDPASAPPHPGFGSQPNYVLDPNKPFNIELEWEGEGFFLPLWMHAMNSNWVVKAYAETVGPGPDVALVTNSLEPKANYGGSYSNRKWKHTLSVPAGKLVEGDPGSLNSGIYKISVTIFLNSSIAGGYDISGFTQKSITVRAEAPA